MNTDRLRANLDAVRARIDAACRRARRDPAGVTLVAVTKSVPPDVIRSLVGLGVEDIGENRPAEALARVGSLTGCRRHMIGHLQTNKLGKTLAWADRIHSVDRPSLLQALVQSNKKVPIFVQVNVSGEASKGGYAPQDAEAAVAEARSSLEVLGLMTMAPEGADARPHFRRLRELAARCGLSGLSMGMSQDFEAGVEEGATHVRIGTAIFEGVLI
ncbi:MAG: YggS family pyridoxal phosphate enzyme [Planctomycetaceae bacterium]|nr:YggS family pyridoxal phosphate enzyme [Planctomycetaceae bacterium]